jgi:hypothetical protein
MGEQTAIMVPQREVDGKTFPAKPAVAFAILR